MNEELEREQGEEVMDDSNAASGEAMQSDDLPNEGMSVAMQIRDRIIAVIKTVYDPEIPVDIYELGLVYGVEVTDDGEAHVTMTLTSPMCPVAETLPPEVEDKVQRHRGQGCESRPRLGSAVERGHDVGRSAPRTQHDVDRRV